MVAGEDGRTAPPASTAEPVDPRRYRPLPVVAPPPEIRRTSSSICRVRTTGTVSKRTCSSSPGKHRTRHQLTDDRANLTTPTTYQIDIHPTHNIVYLTRSIVLNDPKGVGFICPAQRQPPRIGRKPTRDPPVRDGCSGRHCRHHRRTWPATPPMPPRD
ncbi:hypothetical protein STPH2_7193 [Streptomyces sp. KO7888]|nr:hypothetical protein [Streptomyces sp. KO7888]